MSGKERYFIVVAAIIAIFAIIISALGWLNRPLTTPPSAVPKVVALHAFTNKINSEREHCFYNSDSERPLYVDAYTDIPVNGMKFTFALYSMIEGNYKSMTFKDGDLTINPMGNVIHITVNNSQPPHLGSGPYMAMVSAQTPAAISIAPGGAPDAKYSAIGYYFYETWPQPRDSYSSDCWYRP